MKKILISLLIIVSLNYVVAGDPGQEEVYLSNDIKIKAPLSLKQTFDKLTDKEKNNFLAAYYLSLNNCNKYTCEGESEGFHITTKASSKIIFTFFRDIR